jgi:hypothetical protein
MIQQCLENFELVITNQIAPFGLCTGGIRCRFSTQPQLRSSQPEPTTTTANLDCHRPAHLKPVRNSLTLSPLPPPRPHSARLPPPQSSTAAGPPPAPPPPPFVPLPAPLPPSTRLKGDSSMPVSAPPFCASIDLRPCGTRGCTTHPRS